MTVRKRRMMLKRLNIFFTRQGKILNEIEYNKARAIPYRLATINKIFSNYDNMVLQIDNVKSVKPRFKYTDNLIIPTEWNPFKNKNIAVVGNADFLVEGALIDTKDIVIRFNQGIHIKNYPTRGKKLSYACVPNSNKIVSLKGVRVPIIITTKFLFRSTYKRMRFTQKPLHSLDKDYIWLPWENSLDIFYKLEQCDPSSGAHILNYLTYCDPESVDIFGFDWKDTKSFYHNKIKKGPHQFDKERSHFTDVIRELNWTIH